MFEEIKKNLKESEDTLEKLSAEVVELNKKKLSIDEMKEALSNLVDEKFSWYKDDPEAEFEFSGEFPINDEYYEFCVVYEDPDNIYAELRDEDANNYAVEQSKPEFPDIENKIIEEVTDFLTDVEGVSALSSFTNLEYGRVCKFTYGGSTYVVRVEEIY